MSLPNENTPDKQADKKYSRRYMDFGDEEDELDDERVELNLRTFFGGDIFTDKWFQRHILFIILCVGLLILYVSERYACQKETLRTVQLEDTLLDRRYKLLTISSQLKEQLRPSVIEDNLTDTTLHTPTTPPYKLPVENPE